MTVGAQKNELEDLRQRSSKELEQIEQQMEMIDFYIATANSLQVGKTDDAVMCSYVLLYYMVQASVYLLCYTV